MISFSSFLSNIHFLKTNKEQIFFLLLWIQLSNVHGKEEEKKDEFKTPFILNSNWKHCIVGKREYQFPWSICRCVNEEKNPITNTHALKHAHSCYGVISMYWNLIKNLIEIMIDDINDGIENSNFKLQIGYLAVSRRETRQLTNVSELVYFRAWVRTASNIS